MPVNSDKTHLWKADVVRSVDFYNDWFLKFAPSAYRETRVQTTEAVKLALEQTNNLRNIVPELLQQHPDVLPMLRMATAPPIARDRLIGLAGVSPNLVRRMELDKQIPMRMAKTALIADLKKIASIIERLADPEIFTWLATKTEPTEKEQTWAATIVADRLCGAVSDPIIRNAQERRQLGEIKTWLEARGYKPYAPTQKASFKLMPPGTFSFRLNVPVTLGSTGVEMASEEAISSAATNSEELIPNGEILSNGESEEQPTRNGYGVKIPIDAVIMPLNSKLGELPLLIEAKSAGDFTNTNKRRKEEAVKISQLKGSYGEGVRFILFLCGYFDTGYLGYEAAEGIDWVWEHRIDDLTQFGL